MPGPSVEVCHLLGDDEICVMQFHLSTSNLGYLAPLSHLLNCAFFAGNAAIKSGDIDVVDVYMLQEKS